MSDPTAHPIIMSAGVASILQTLRTSHLSTARYLLLKPWHSRDELKRARTLLDEASIIGLEMLAAGRRAEEESPEAVPIHLLMPILDHLDPPAPPTT